MGSIHARLYQAMGTDVSLKTRIYSAALASITVVTLYLAFSLLAQRHLAAITHDILDNRITAMQSAEQIKESLRAYDDNLFRYLATHDLSQLRESETLRTETGEHISKLLTLDASAAVQSQLLLLQSESQRYFSDAELLMSFSEKNNLPSNAGIFAAADWARRQGAQHRELGFLSEDGRMRMNRVFSLCDEIIVMNQVNLENARKSMNDTLQLSRKTAWQAGLAAVALVVFITIGLAVSLVGPLRILLDGVKKVQEGHLDFEIPITRLDEIGQLTQAFNHMTQTVKQQKQKLLEESITDSLTSLYNQRYFRQRLKREIDRARRSQQNVSLLMLDIDHFKHYNDTFGHEFGNDVLKRVSETLKSQLRESDCFARYGGDELAIILPDTASAQAQLLGEKLASIVKSMDGIETSKLKEKSLTISIGGASFPDNAIEGNELIRKADEALYVAKRTGRARLHWYSPNDPLEKAPISLKKV